MEIFRSNRSAIVQISLRCVCIAAILAGLPSGSAQTGDKNAQAGSVTLDRVVAVVNRRAILESDVQDEMQLSILDPSTSAQDKVTEPQALERLISRALIQQQIEQENVPAPELKPEEIAARVQQIRTQLPACVRANCKSDEGWKTFLARHELTPERVNNYMRNRIEILGFIEMRFRQGTRISPEEIETYYREKLLPQYPSNETPPPLDQVSARIEEILLEQQVNAMFDTWLANLRKQGQIEVLDPSLETTGDNGSEGATKE